MDVSATFFLLRLSFFGVLSLLFSCTPYISKVIVNNGPSHKSELASYYSSQYAFTPHSNSGKRHQKLFVKYSYYSPNKEGEEYDLLITDQTYRLLSDEEKKLYRKITGKDKFNYNTHKQDWIRDYYTFDAYEYCISKRNGRVGSLVLKTKYMYAVFVRKHERMVYVACVS